MNTDTSDANTAQRILEFWLAEKIRAFKEAVAKLKESESSSDHVES
ncbi:MAG: hypothetical protein IT405_03700 [Candidatus Yanofskybacteria bacterium]|nr:hypothetical protein [Candidatus Yanofskybacteria bacterium]